MRKARIVMAALVLFAGIGSASSSRAQDKVKNETKAPVATLKMQVTKILAAALHRPALFPAPAFALRLILGEMADSLLLSSQRVQPVQLQKLSYQFHHPDLVAALAAILK